MTKMPQKMMSTSQKMTASSGTLAIRSWSMIEISVMPAYMSTSMITKSS